MKSKPIAELKKENGEKPFLRYVLYARKSSEDVGSQAKSLPDQIKDCLDYAENKGIVVVETLKESHSAKISGRRPVFSQMLKNLEAGKYDGILAWHPDRLARNSLEAGMIVDMVDSGKIKDLKFPTLEFTNDSSGKLLLNIMFAMSKQYSEHLSESVQRGVDSNLRQGKSGGMPKWGYNRDEVTGFYKPDENFDLVKRGLEMYIEGYSQRDIIRFWREHDVHRMTKLTRRNKNVHRVTIYNSEAPIGTILSDPFYYGVLVQGGQKVDLREILPDFQPMITEEQFEQIQALRHKIKKIPTASVKAKDDKVFIPFRQLVKCGVCGNFMHVARSTARSGKKFLYFRCGNPECERKQKNIRA
ncbi:recombinase family protein [Candidatus Saccharibacteria bacterium]|nr:recombinase family protein [Candidatus Saccharibacteria bacterium]